MKQGATIQSLQVGRAIAAIMVVLHHAAFMARDFTSGLSLPVFSVLERGYLGVDFFFVLSGFIIYHTTVDGRTNALSYVERRLTRVYLPYLPVGLGIAVLYSRFVPTSHDWNWLSTIFLVPSDQGPALSVAWTLQHELVFYLLFGVLYFSRFLKTGLIAWGAVIVIYSVLDRAGNHALDIMFGRINIEFLFGVILAIYIRESERCPDWFWFACSATSCGVWIALGADRQFSVLIGLAVTLALIPIVRRDLAARYHFGHPALFLGAASYAIYLIHNPVLSVIGRAAHMTGANGYTAMTLGVIASILAGAAYHVAVDRPLQRKFRQRSSRASTQPYEPVKEGGPG
jgi:exopolysaccharide production protein ExoZ